MDKYNFISVPLVYPMKYCWMDIGGDCHREPLQVPITTRMMWEKSVVVSCQKWGILTIHFPITGWLIEKLVQQRLHHEPSAASTDSTTTNASLCLRGPPGHNQKQQFLSITLGDVQKVFWGIARPMVHSTGFRIPQRASEETRRNARFVSMTTHMQLEFELQTGMCFHSCPGDLLKRSGGSRHGRQAWYNFLRAQHVLQSLQWCNHGQHLLSVGGRGCPNKTPCR